jgi:hypothetical protein
MRKIKEYYPERDSKMAERIKSVGILELLEKFT